MTALLMWLMAGTSLVGCSVQSGPEAAKTGAQVLHETEYRVLAGKRVGLIANHTARVGEEHLTNLIDRAEQVELVAIFGPEHGLRGTEEDGAEIVDGSDDQTGVPVYSLYGDTRRPTARMLHGIDILVFDIQDVGARFYTFISTMGLAMQAAAENDIPFLVLDRPNPIGGQYVSGYVLEPEHASFVGQYPIPIAHGMTTGELARMIVGEAMLPGLANLELDVIAMEGWERSMLWPDTRLPWVDTSPNIMGFETALVYPGTCFFEATAASEGRGTQTPFLLLGAPWVDARALASTLNEYGLPGVRFEPDTFVPRPIAGKDSRPKLQGQVLGAVRIVVTDPRTFEPVETGVHVLHTFYHMAPQADAFLARPEWLARLAGTTRLAALLQEGAPPSEITRGWQSELATFRARRTRYLLY